MKIKTRLNHLTGPVIMLLLGLIAATPALHAGYNFVDYTWSPVTSGTWNVPANWGGVTPTDSNGAYISNGGTALLPSNVTGAYYKLLVNAGTIDITGGALSSGNFNGAGAHLGSSAGGWGTATVTSGTWSNDVLYVGESGSGSLTVDGGYVFDTQARIGYAEGGVGIATVNSGTWSNYSVLQIGDSGNGSLTINGGYVSSASSVIGVSGTGIATINSGTWSTSSYLSVGNYGGVGNGKGTLAINGGYVSAQNGEIGEGLGGKGDVTVSGGTLSLAASMIVGYSSGTGSLTINGGYVSDQNGTIGSNYNGDTNSGTGTVTVSSGTWNNSNSLTIGNSARGVLNLTDTGVVTINAGSGTLTLGNGTTCNGTLNLGTGGEVGTLNAAEVRGSGGAATVNFNLSGTTTFAPKLTGSLAVTKSGAGALTISGSNSYTGGTTLNAGTLIAGNNNAFGTGSIIINAGTLLVQTGVTTPNNVILNGGGLAQTLGSGSALANAIDTSSTLGGSTTGALLLGGTTSASATLESSFAATSGAANDNVRLSSVFHLSGIPVIDLDSGQTDTFVLQLQLASIQSDSFLGWLDPGSNRWVNAVLGNIGGTASFQGNGAYNPSTDFVLGYYGVDISAHTVWAVINHNSDFSTIGTVPEPSTWALLALGLTATFVVSRRKKQDN